MDEFGRRLRSVRRERGLSQGEVGGGRYSASYISHLESGRRPPTPEIVEHLATRLGVAPTELLGVELDSYADANAAMQLALVQFRVQAAWNERDYEAVVALCPEAATVADSLERPDAWWNVTFRLAEALLVLERHGEAVAAARELAQHRVARLAPDLRAEALALASKAARAGGNLMDAITWAEEGTAAAVESGNTISLVTALLAEVAASAELGDLEHAAHAGGRLDEARRTIRDGQLAGLAAWSLGNLAFLHGDVQGGIREHESASVALRPDSDLRAWGRFNKASAAMRLKVGVREGLDQLLANAEHALSLVGNEGDRHEFALVSAEAVVCDDPERALSLVAAVQAEAGATANIAAGAALLRARAYARLGRPEEERTQLVEAARQFEAAGAERRALEVWRELAGYDPKTPGLPV